jgi:hypothetical protein
LKQNSLENWVLISFAPYMRANHAFYGLIFLNFLGACYAKTEPEFRPAIIGTGRRSLVNLIDTNSLMKQGQGNAMVMFTCVVSSLGHTSKYYTRVYGATPGSEALVKELFGKIGQASFLPAIYSYAPQTAVVSGTVVFVVTQGKPHLAIYLNQEMDDLKRGNDFIAPQLLLLPGSNLNEIDYPARAGGAYGTFAARMDIDASGKVTRCNKIYEYPPGLDHGAKMTMQIRGATFLPGYRNGKPVACSFTFGVHRVPAL